MSNCSCGNPSSHRNSISICDPCNTNTGCALQLDFECIIYHKSNNQITNLTCLELTNGATLNQFAEIVDSYICQIKVAEYVLPCLDADYTITNLKQFAEAVDTELCLIKGDITIINTTLANGIVKTDSQSIDLSGSGFGLQADLKVDPASGNRLSVSGTGVLVPPQDLNPNYVTKTLTVTGGNNVVQMSSFFSTVQGYLGPVASNPVGTVAGQSWWRTDTSKFKFNVDGTTIIDLN